MPPEERPDSQDTYDRALAKATFAVVVLHLAAHRLPLSRRDARGDAALGAFLFTLLAGLSRGSGWSSYPRGGGLAGGWGGFGGGGFGGGGLGGGGFSGGEGVSSGGGASGSW